MDKNKPKTMEEFGTWFKRTTLAYVALIFVLVLSYGYLVKGGSWGSFSDLIIAVFTVLIAYTTNLLLIAAWLTGNSWVEQSKHHSAKELLQTLSEFYFTIHEVHTMEFKLQSIKSLHKVTVDNFCNLSDAGKRYFEGTPDDASKEQIEDFLNYMKPIYDEEIQKYYQKISMVKDRLNELKFAVMVKSTPFSVELKKENIEMINEINGLLSMKENFHTPTSSLFEKLRSVTNYDSFELIYISDPIKEELFDDGK
ncbi:hypothetical protein [Pseudoalteromonas sp. PAB 2.2]|uniref:hypothetical protein n=1 Tax=Pseudoalteromonas sp. PAB 2.2 TaxID=1841508 RepID=UPI00095029DC|nr:hypothetical protein [Pseudoalteromonas sp. PAB 2.2]